MERYFKKRLVLKFLLAIVVFPFLFSVNAQSLVKGPYLANPNHNSITVRWESDSQTEFILLYGESETLNKSKRAEFISQKKSGYLYCRH